MLNVLQRLNGIVWGVPALVLIIGVGIYLSIQTRFSQIFLLPNALKSFGQKLRSKKTSDDSVSPHRALCTALAATVGTGNIVGVAGAISLGGPGAIFWMWFCAFLGMITKYAEAVLAVHFRTVNNRGEYVGGPMYMIKNGLPPQTHVLAFMYSFLGIIAALGVGNATQVNAVIGGINTVIEMYGVQPTSKTDLALGILIAIFIAMILFGGAKKIGEVAEKLVPFASVCYLALCCAVLLIRASALPDAFGMILKGAFTPSAVTGGAIGSIFVSIRVGASRGVFTNEAGMGTASIAHSAADVRHPSDQGLMGIMEVFIDTIVICTMTALVILCSEINIEYGVDVGINLTACAFSSVLGEWVRIPISIMLCCFAIATILGWGLYGMRCAQFLFGENCWNKFVFLQVIAVIFGALLKTGTVWLLSELVNGLMAIPNLMALALLTPELVKLTKEYKENFGSFSANGGTYANFYQCKPLRAVADAKVPSSCYEGEGCG